MFLNLVLEQSFEELGAGERKPCGTSVSLLFSAVFSHDPDGGILSVEDLAGSTLVLSRGMLSYSLFGIE